MYHSFKKKINPTLKGFSLLELLISIGILVLVLSIVFTNQKSFNSAVLLRSQAYEIALQIRDTQFFAVSVVSDNVDYRNIYGLHFVENSANYKIFRDDDSSLNYYFNAGEEFGKQGVVNPKFFIDEIRKVENNGSESPIPNVSVVFERPNFDARFFAGENSVLNAQAVEIDVRIKGASGNGGGVVRTIEITKTGQISVQ